MTTSYRYVDHKRSTQIKVTTFVSQASTHLAATQISLTPDFDGTVELSFALNLWAPHQPRLPLAKLTGEQMQEAVAANNMQLVAIPPATPDRAAVWYHGDTHVLAADGDVQGVDPGARWPRGTGPRYGRGGGRCPAGRRCSRAISRCTRVSIASP